MTTMQIESAARSLRRRIQGPTSGSPLVSAEIRHLGGALARSAPHHGALDTLDAPFMTFGVGVGIVVDEDGHRTNRSQLDVIAAAPAAYDNGRQYLNVTEVETDPARFYRAAAYARLREVRAAVDPGEVFRSNHPIPSAG